MRYGSVPLTAKACATCGATKPLSDFHKQPSGPLGRHSYCKDCFNGRWRGVSRKPVAPSIRRDRNFRVRYGLSATEVADLLSKQGGCCSICQTRPKRPVVDHDHLTGAVRGILCDRCNLRLTTVEDEEFVRRARLYLRGRS